MIRRFSTMILVITMIFNSLTVNANAEKNEDIKVIVDGEELEFDVPPVVVNNRTLVPVRAIFEALDAQVDWDPKTNSVIALKGEKTVKLPIGKRVALVNDEEIYLDVPSKVVNNRTMVPIRFISETLDCKVEWVGETRTIVITRSEVSELLELANANLKNIDSYTHSVTFKYERNLEPKNFSSNTKVDITNNQMYSVANHEYTIAEGRNKGEYKHTIERNIGPFFFVELSEFVDDKGEYINSSIIEMAGNVSIEDDIHYLTTKSSGLELDEDSNIDYFIIKGNDIDNESIKLLLQQLSNVSNITANKINYNILIDKNTYLPYKEILIFEGTIKGEEVKYTHEETFDHYNETVITLSDKMQEQIMNFDQEDQLLEYAKEKTADENYKEAIEVYEYILSKDETNYNALMNILDVIYELEGYSERLKSYNAILEENYPTDIDALFQMGVIASAVSGELALSYYEKILDIEPNNAKVLNYAGVKYHHRKEYEKALEYYEKAILYDKNSEAELAYRNKAHALIQLEKNDECITFVEKNLSKVKSNNVKFDMLDFQQMAYSNKGDFENAIKILKSMLTYYPNNKSVIFGILNKLKEIELYDEMGQYFTILEENYSEDVEALLKLGKIKSEVEGYEEGVKYYEKAIELAPDNAEVFNQIGVNLYKLEKYDEAIEYFTKAIESNRYYYTAFTNKAYVLYETKAYDECIQFINQNLYNIKENDIKVEVLEYEYFSYLEKNQKENALEVLREIYHYSSDKENSILRFLKLATELQKLYDVEYFLNILKELNPQHSSFEYYEEVLNYYEKPINVRIYNFIKQYYLYLDEDFEEISENFLSLDEVRYSDIKNYLTQVTSTNDYFTQIVSDDDYDRLIDHKEDNSITYQELNSDTDYIKINDFNVLTYYGFKDIMNKLENKENKTLVIDLRNNFGIDTDVAFTILDYFLDEKIMSTLIDRDGYTYSINSNDSIHRFKKIKVFVNKNTASSAELLTLGLKTYLDNVTVIGEQTAGKGVAQYAFEDKRRNIMFYLTSYYWNIKQDNINNKGIKPDIQVEQDEDLYYFEKLNK